MRYENVELTGSLQVTGSIIVPVGGDDERINITGSLFLNTQSNQLEVFTGESGSDWVDVFGGSGGSGDTPAGDTSVEYLVIAGGGGGAGGFGNGNGTGGGGAGGLLSSSFSSLSSGSSFTVTVGAGGTGGTGTAFSGLGSTNRGADGGASSISGTGITTVTSTGGGSGGRGSADWTGNDGGSGGGEGAYAGNGAPGSGTTGQGNDGGAATPSGNTNYRGGGGGGAGSAGVSGVTSGDGGTGQASNITGTSTTYAGGGGSGCFAGRTPGDGGTGGGGNGSAGAADATAGTANRGSGGGGGGWPSSGGTAGGDGGAGGSGVVILAYSSSSINAAGGITGDAGNGRKYHQFNSSDTFVVGATTDFNVVTDNLVLHLDAGDFSSRNSTSQWDDISGNGYDATLVSSPSLGSNPYYTFDGSSDYGYFATAAHTAISAQTQGTVECWVRIDTVSGRDTIFGTGHSSQTDRWAVVRNHSTLGVQLSINADGTDYGAYTGTALTANTWTHLVFNYDGTSNKIYVNGVSQSVTNGTGGAGWFNNSGTNTLQVGALDRGSLGNSYDPWDGRIAQVRVYSDVLTAAEVLQNYNATKTNFV